MSQETEAHGEDDVRDESRDNVSFNVEKGDSPAWTNTVRSG